MWTVSYLAQAYLYWSFRGAVKNGKARLAVLAFLAAMMTLMMFRSRLFVGEWGEWLSRLTLLWIGCLIFLTVAMAVRDTLTIVASVIGKRTGRLWRANFRSRPSFLAACGAGLFLFGYSLHEAASVRVTVLTIETDKLPQNTREVRIAAFADFHLDRFSRLSRLEEAVAMANAQKPDIIAVLGDFVDTDMTGRDADLETLRGLAAPGGKYFVVGNHEVYRGVGQAVAFMAAAGFRTLRGETVEVEGITVAGVDDPLVGGRRSITATLARRDPERFTLLLSHRPETPPEARGMFDLQLSGHTHGGQIWPGWILSRFVNAHVRGLTALDAPDTDGRTGGAIYVTNGIGYKGPPVRLFTPPEIVVVVLIRTDNPHVPAE